MGCVWEALEFGLPDIEFSIYLRNKWNKLPSITEILNTNSVVFNLVDGDMIALKSFLSLSSKMKGGRLSLLRL